MKINFSNVTSSTLLPEGNYTVEVEKIEMPAGKDYYSWQFKIIASELEGNYAGRKVWGITSLKENALWKLQEYLVALGVDEEQLKSDDFDFEPADYVGMEASATIVQSEYQGKVRNDINLIASSLEAMNIFK